MTIAHLKVTIISQSDKVHARMSVWLTLMGELAKGLASALGLVA